MIRRRATALMALVLAFAGVRAQAQVTVQIHGVSDTAIGLVPNTPTTIPVYINPNGTSFIRARMTFHYDPAQITIEGAEFQMFSGLWSAVDTARGSGTFTVGASSSFFLNSGTPFQVFSLRVRLAAGSTNGTFLYAQFDSLQTQFFGEQGFNGASDVGQMCHAADLYGDVDASGEVDSRDALITLTAAIGLPAPGFNLAVGDVDNDSRTNSRDALIMLSHSIGAYIGITHRASLGVPDACPPLTPLTDRIVFVRRGVTFDSLFTLAPGSITPAYVPGTANYQGYIRAPRLSSGNVIVFTCLRSNMFICRVNADGTALDSLAPSVYGTPDWSPGDSLILFENAGGALWTIDPSGGNLLQRTPPLPLNSSPGQGYAFSRDGSTIAYPVASTAARLIGLDGQNDVAISSDMPRSDIVRWNPAGDSLALASGGRTGFWLVPVTGGTARHVSSFRVYTTSFEAIDWGADGLLFAHVTQPAMRGIYLIPANGGPLRRITNGADRQPAFRRNP